MASHGSHDVPAQMANCGSNDVPVLMPSSGSSDVPAQMASSGSNDVPALIKGSGAKGQAMSSSGSSEYTWRHWLDYHSLHIPAWARLARTWDGRLDTGSSAHPVGSHKYDMHWWGNKDMGEDIQDEVGQEQPQVASTSSCRWKAPPYSKLLPEPQGPSNG